MSDIELLDLRPVTSGGNVRAFVSIRLGGVTIHTCKIVQQPGQTAWLAMPDRPYTDASGKQKQNWTAIVELSPELKRRVSDSIIAEWERRCASGTPPPPRQRGIATDARATSDRSHTGSTTGGGASAPSSMGTGIG